MKLTFEQATAYSQKGYIDDEKEIGEIFLKLLETPVVDIGGLKRRFIFDMIGTLLDCHDCNSDEKKRDLTFSEFLAFTKKFDLDSKKAEKEYISLNKKCYYIFLCHTEDILRSGNNSTATFFKCIRVIDFIKYAEKNNKYRLVANDDYYKTFIRNVEDSINFKIEENTTIGEYLNELNRFQSVKWMPDCHPDIFGNQIQSSYDQMAYLLIECAMSVYPELFDFIYERNDEEWQIF